MIVGQPRPGTASVPMISCNCNRIHDANIGLVRVGLGPKFNYACLVLLSSHATCAAASVPYEYVQCTAERQPPSACWRQQSPHMLPMHRRGVVLDPKVSQTLALQSTNHARGKANAGGVMKAHMGNQSWQTLNLSCASRTTFPTYR